MKVLLASIAIVVLSSLTPALAQNIEAGSRVTVTSDWHSKNGGPYKPKIVSCESDSGLCLRDTSSSPANKPMTKTNGGLRVVFNDFGVVYLFKSGGEGAFQDMNGNQTGKFMWSQ